MLAVYGYRTRHGCGRHDAPGRYLAAILETPPQNAASHRFEQMRRDRNRSATNEARPITTAPQSLRPAAAWSCIEPPPHAPGDGAHGRA